MIKKLTRILIITSLLIIALSIAFNVYLYYHIQAPVFKSLISARIIGSDDVNIFVQMTWEMENISRVPYEITSAELYFYEFDQVIARVYFADNDFINALSNTILKVNASIKRETFERLMTNYIEQYSFHLVGSIKTQILFIPVYLEVNKHIPVNIKELIDRFITESFRNSITVDNIRFLDERNNNFMLCNLNILNRAKLNIVVSSFIANVEINRGIIGVVDFFEPFQFRHYETHRSTNVRFLFPSATAQFTGLGTYRYRINGRLNVELWNEKYNLPVEVIGEY